MRSQLRSEKLLDRTRDCVLYPAQRLFAPLDLVRGVPAMIEFAILARGDLIAD